MKKIVIALAALAIAGVAWAGVNTASWISPKAGSNPYELYIEIDGRTTNNPDVPLWFAHVDGDEGAPIVKHGEMAILYDPSTAHAKGEKLVVHCSLGASLTESELIDRTIFCAPLDLPFVQK